MQSNYRLVFKIQDKLTIAHNASSLLSNRFQISSNNSKIQSLIANKLFSITLIESKFILISDAIVLHLSITYIRIVYSYNFATIL